MAIAIDPVCGMTVDVAAAEAAGLLLEYEGGDKLYVPVAQLHLISRYTGVSAEEAPLHKLGSGQWEKAKKRAAKQAHDTAAELLNLYAQRAARVSLLTRDLSELLPDLVALPHAKKRVDVGDPPGHHRAVALVDARHRRPVFRLPQRRIGERGELARVGVLPVVRDAHLDRVGRVQGRGRPVQRGHRPGAAPGPEGPRGGQPGAEHRALRNHRGSRARLPL